MQLISKRSLKSKLSYLESLLERMERHNPQVQSLLRFKALSPIEQADIRGKWEEYYRLVRETPAYKRFVEQKEAMRRNDLETVRRLALEAKSELAERNYIPRPQFDDPNYLFANASSQLYFSLLRDIKNLKNELLQMGDEDLIAEEILK